MTQIRFVFKGLMQYKSKRFLFVLRAIQNTKMECNQRIEILILKMVVRKVTARL